MKPFHITFINALTLIVMGLWGYFSATDPSLTALISVFAGIILLILTRGVRDANRTIAHITVIITLIMLIALIKPLSGSIARNDSAAVARVLVMMLTCAIALIVYIKSFIDVRKQRS